MGAHGRDRDVLVPAENRGDLGPRNHYGTNPFAILKVFTATSRCPGGGFALSPPAIGTGHSRRPRRARRSIRGEWGPAAPRGRGRRSQGRGPGRGRPPPGG